MQIEFDRLINPKGNYDNETGRDLYGYIAKLGKTFVTTNYDAWLDTHIVASKPALAVPGQQEQPPEVARRRLVFDAVNDFIPANLGRSDAVFHLHGSLRKPEEMVLTTRDYITRYANDRKADDPTKENRTLTFLEHLFEHRTVLFIGYGLEELEILEYVIQKSRPTRNGEDFEARHFMLQGYFSHEYELMLSLKKYYRSECGIQLLPFCKDRRGYDQLLYVLENFAERVPASEPMHLQKLVDMENLLD